MYFVVRSVPFGPADVAANLVLSDPGRLFDFMSSVKFLTDLQTFSSYKHLTQALRSSPRAGLEPHGTK